jgi:hypothetical protein
MTRFKKTLLASSGASFGLGALAILLVVRSENGYVAGYVFFPLLILVFLVSIVLFVAGLITLIFNEKTGVVVVLSAVSLLAGFIGSGLIAKQLQLGAYREEPMVSWPAEVSNAVLFKKGTTDEQINDFLDNTLSVKDADGRGHWTLPGVRDIGRLSAHDGHEVIEFGFFPSATDEQKQYVYERVRSSQIVFELRENVSTRDYVPSSAPESNSSEDRRKQ